VLIPRPETELLIDLALARIPPSGLCALLDLGTGSGNIAVTLALERPDASVTATDASTWALSTAEANACRLGARSVRLLPGDWFDPLGAERFDLIVSNPPYVAAGDPHLRLGDVRFEPRAALVGGADGLDATRRIVAQARVHLNPGGWLIFEHGFDQAGACAVLLEAAGYRERFMSLDLAGLPRVSGARAPLEAGSS
jgi:release factor glutamine methyltransferase